MPVSKGYLLKRIILLFVVVFGVLIITFVITRVIPAHPELLWAGPHATAEQIQQARIQLHLDKPIYVQLYYYLADFMRGDWGVSWRTRQPVLSDILTYLPATLEITTTAIAIAFLLGVPLGMQAAIRYNTYLEKAISILSALGASVPVFWLALIVQTVFGIWLGWLPAGKRIDEVLAMQTGFHPITNFYLLDSILEGNLPVFLDVLKRMILPVSILSIYPLSLTVRMTRSLTIEALNENYVRAINIWGIPKRRVMTKYVLKNIISPVVASLGLTYGYTITGALMVELVFVYPGIGYYIGMALLSYDYPAITGSIVFIALIYSTINFAVDLLHAWLDPRVKL
ncbi:MAG: ABC transporter permease [Fervidicoccaceae archaeon]